LSRRAKGNVGNRCTMLDVYYAGLLNADFIAMLYALPALCRNPSMMPLSIAFTVSRLVQSEVMK
jgi:hypothetical protein